MLGFVFFLRPPPCRCFACGTLLFRPHVHVVDSLSRNTNMPNTDANINRGTTMTQHKHITSTWSRRIGQAAGHELACWPSYFGHPLATQELRRKMQIRPKLEIAQHGRTSLVLVFVSYFTFVSSRDAKARKTRKFSRKAMMTCSVWPYQRFYAATFKIPRRILGFLERGELSSPVGHAQQN